MLRGTHAVDAEFADICEAAQQAAQVSALQVRGRAEAQHARAWLHIHADPAGCFLLLVDLPIDLPLRPSRFCQSFANLFNMENLPMTVRYQLTDGQLPIYSGAYAYKLPRHPVTPPQCCARPPAL